MKILDMLDLAKDFTVIKLSEKYDDDYKVESKNSDLVAFINETSIKYAVSGVYNSGSNLVEIDIEDLNKLVKFCEFVVKYEVR